MGVGVMQTKNEVLLEQCAYTKALLSSGPTDRANSVATPVDVNADLVTTSDEVEDCDKDLYQSAVVGAQQLEFTKQFKYLGVMLDSPQLRWHHQVEYLKQSCAPLLNLLQSISHRNWGADRELLIHLYKTLIRSRLDYAAPLYGTAALSNLLQLNSIQNNCLRIATGCRKTSPAASLKVEANIFPLTIRRDLVTCQYYSKLQQLPNDMADDLL
ncbi:hypothetical protein FHG87_008715 [Trinorchestia longiramus]|nr:hypothetical protein FHG87_008715 [Trinorchestia longiramus]